MVKRALPEVLEGMKLFLKMLSFRLGTLLLCGHRCLSWKWPFIHSFSEMSLEKREEVLKKWSKEKLVLTLRLMFLVVKIFCFYTFFSRVILHLILSPMSHTSLSPLHYPALSLSLCWDNETDNETGIEKLVFLLHYYIMQVLSDLSAGPFPFFLPFFFIIYVICSFLHSWLIALIMVRQSKRTNIP